MQKKGKAVIRAAHNPFLYKKSFSIEEDVRKFGKRGEITRRDEGSLASTSCYEVSSNGAGETERYAGNAVLIDLVGT